MEAYLQASAFGDGLRVRVQDDARGRFVNVHFETTSGGAYLSVDPAMAERLVDELADALEELARRRPADSG
jgi:hypothetical protein